MSPTNPGIPLALGWIEPTRVNLPAVQRRAATLGTKRTVKQQWQAAWMLRYKRGVWELAEIVFCSSFPPSPRMWGTGTWSLGCLTKTTLCWSGILATATGITKSSR